MHLLTWTDRGAGPLSHHQPRSADDRGPVLRLLDATPGVYSTLTVLTSEAALPGARGLAREAKELGLRVHLQLVDVTDPSDHTALFAVLRPLAAGWSGPVDVVLSAGTPQAQTMWVILMQAGLLTGRMLQVIPPAFVPDPHPHPVREVRFDIEGFPEIRALRDQVRRLRAEVQVEQGDIIGVAPPMQALRERIARVAPSELAVLIVGETGTGKELVAREIHRRSGRSSGPWVAVNCGAIAEGVLGSELFGHEAGAFTGATRRHRGLFEQAHGGTLFIDEVGEMPLRVQVQLLRVLETGMVRRVGAEEEHAVDVRIVAATHRDLVADVSARRFREDLYYRLRGAELVVPALRERIGDLEELVRHFLGGSTLSLTAPVWSVLRGWRWPGNVRELRAEVQRWTVFCEGEIRLEDLSPELGPAGPSPLPPSGGEVRRLAEVVADTERAAIAHALSACGHNLSATARALGIDRNTLKRKMVRYPTLARGRGAEG